MEFFIFLLKNNRSVVCCYIFNNVSIQSIRISAGSASLSIRLLIPPLRGTYRESQFRNGSHYLDGVVVGF